MGNYIDIMEQIIDLKLQMQEEKEMERGGNRSSKKGL